MNLEMAQHIIEQEALLILIANPELSLDRSSGRKLSTIFSSNKSEIITIIECGCQADSTGIQFCYIFKINHPKHGIGYYRTVGHDDISLGTASMITANHYPACRVGNEN